MKVLFLILIPFILFAQTTWYVSNGGNDSNAGTSSGAPLLTIAAAQDSAVTAGDSCLFNKDDIWRETLTVGASGGSGNPIVFSSYGSGADPIISGSDAVSTWEDTEILADDFETGDASLWTGSTGTPVFDGESAQNGSYGLHSDFAGSRYVHQTISTKTAVLSGSFNLKAENLANGNRGPIAVLNDGTNYFRLWLLQDGSGNVQVDATIYSDASPAGAMIISLDTWYDYVWEVHIDATAGYVKLSVDGTNKVNDTGINTGTDALTQLRLGADGYQEELLDIYHDDVTIDSSKANIWSATLASDKAQLFFDGVRGTKVDSVLDLDATREWYWLSNVVWVYSTVDPDNITMSSPARNRTITLSSKDYITIDGLSCVNSDTSTKGSIYINNSDNVTLQNNTINYNGGFAGVFAEGSGVSNTISSNTISYSYHPTSDRGAGLILDGAGNNHTVSSNTINNNTANGIKLGLWTATDTTTISSNTVHTNGSSGINVNRIGSNRIVISGNTVYNNITTVSDRYNIDLFQVGSGNVVKNNIVYTDTWVATDAGGIRFDADPGPVWGKNDSIYCNVIYNVHNGIHLLSVDSNYVFNNTIYNTDSVGIWNHGATADLNTIKNNILHTAGNYLIYNQDATNSVYDYNLFYPSAATAFRFNATELAFSVWQDSTSATNSLSGDPSFTTLGSNFKPTSGSSALNVGLAISGITTDIDGITWQSPPDIGAYEFSAGDVYRFRFYPIYPRYKPKN